MSRLESDNRQRASRYVLSWLITHLILTDIPNVLFFSSTPALARSPTAPVNSDTCHSRTPSTSRLPSGNNVPDGEADEIDSAQVLAESAALENYFQHGFRQEANGDEVEGSDGSEND